MKGRNISIAGYLFEILDDKRVQKYPGEKESWTEFFCRVHGVEYRPFGIKKKARPGRPGRRPKAFIVRKVEKNVKA